MSKEFKLPHDHNNALNGQRIFETLPDLASIEIVADAMKQLGDPTRLRIFWLLCHTEECVVNIASIIEMTSPAVSHHLRLLKTAGLIVSRREGKEMYYKAADTDVVSVLHRSMEEIMRIKCPQ
ncbi:MAG: ArsR/SmtB family transcription factor [Thermoguttaceae bacterium]|jgi:DNA-binding transcriptional ArsR family regulator